MYTQNQNFTDIENKAIEAGLLVVGDDGMYTYFTEGDVVQALEQFAKIIKGEQNE